MSSFVILDPSLRSFNGHFLTYDLTVCAEAGKRGFKPAILAARDVSPNLTAAVDVIPCFRHGLEHTVLAGMIAYGMAPVRSLEDALVGRAFYHDLRSVEERLDLEAGSVLFLHTTTHRQILPAVRFLERIGRRCDVTLVVLLRYTLAPNPFYPESQESAGYRAVLRAVEDSRMGDRVRLLTDSDILQREYRAITQLPIALVPIPHTDHNGALGAPASGIPSLVYLGNARSTKGFQYLPSAVAKVRSDLESGRWLAEFQANVMFRRDIESVVALAILRREPVQLHEHELSIEDYSALLAKAGVVLIPYQHLYYHAQTSGVLVEALAAAKPVVVPRGTWMANQIKGPNVGVTFPPGDRAGFAEAVVEAMGRIEELSQAARIYRREWVAHHNPRVFFDHLLRAI